MWCLVASRCGMFEMGSGVARVRLPPAGASAACRAGYRLCADHRQAPPDFRIRHRRSGRPSLASGAGGNAVYKGRTRSARGGTWKGLPGCHLWRIARRRVIIFYRKRQAGGTDDMAACDAQKNCPFGQAHLHFLSDRIERSRGRGAELSESMNEESDRTGL